MFETGLCLYPIVCAGVARMLHLPVAILWCSLPHDDHLGKAQQGENIALTITTFPPHGSLSVVDPRLSGHIIALETPVVDPRKQKYHVPSGPFAREKHDIGFYIYRDWLFIS